MPLTRVGDIDVYYEKRGSGEPVLLIHGLGSSTEDWEYQVERLASRYTVVSYDVRGHGQTGKPRGRYSVAQFASDAAGLIERLGLGPVHVQGISMGGMIAFQLAVDKPDLVRSLTIVNSGLSGKNSAEGTSGVATSVPSASGTRNSGACAPTTGARC